MGFKAHVLRYTTGNFVRSESLVQHAKGKAHNVTGILQRVIDLTASLACKVPASLRCTLHVRSYCC
jgi:hypothetical protein